MKSEIVNVTPEMAARWLNGMGRNRRLDDRRVNYYADQMKDGKWKLNPHGVVLDKNGVLIDGQHRLQAVLRCQMTVPMNVTTDAEDDVISVIDTGRSRTTQQIIYMMNSGDSMLENKKVISLAKSLIRLKTGKVAISTDDVLECINVHRDAINVMDSIGCFKTGGVLHSPVMLFLLMCYENGEKINDMIAFVNCYRNDDYVDEYGNKWVVKLRETIKSYRFEANQDGLQRVERYYTAFVRNLASPYERSNYMMIPDPFKTINQMMGVTK